MVNQQVLQMRVAVVLTAAVVAIVARVGQQLLRHLVARLAPARRRQLVKPLEHIGLDPRLVIVDPHGRRDVHRRDQHHPLADPRNPDRVSHVLGDADELAPALGLEGLVDGVRLHGVSQQGSRDSNPGSRFWRPRA